TDLSLKHIRRHRGRVFSSAATVWDREFTGTLGKVVALLTVLLTVSSDVCRKFPRAQVSGARLRRVRDSDDYHTTIFDPGAPRSAKSVSYECQKCGCTLGAPRGGPHKQGGSP